MYTEAEKPMRESQVYGQLSSLDKNIADLSGMVEELEKRLSSVLSVDGEQLKEHLPPEQPLVPLAAQIKVSCNGIDKIKARVLYVLGRLEL